MANKPDSYKYRKALEELEMARDNGIWEDVPYFEAKLRRASMAAFRPRDNKVLSAAYGAIVEELEKELMRMYRFRRRARAHGVSDELMRMIDEEVFTLESIKQYPWNVYQPFQPCFHFAFYGNN